MVDFPQELIDAIVDEVAATKYWSELMDRPSQRHLFKSLTRQKKSPPPGTTWATNARLLSYVLDLNLVDLDLGDQEQHIQLFTLCNRVTRCCIRFSGRSGWKWNSLPEKICAPLFSFLALPTLRCLQLDAFPGTSLPPSLIHYALASYSEVVLDTFTLDTDLDAVFLLTRLPSAHIQRLSRLSLPYRPYISPALHRLVLGDDVKHQLQHLQHLELIVPRRGLNDLEEILLNCGDSLQHLIINFRARPDNPLQLPHLPYLRLLTLKASTRTVRIPDALKHTLRILPQCTPSLEVLTIHVGSSYGDSEPYSEIHNRGTEEDTALKCLPRLREVHVEVTTASPQPDRTFSKRLFTEFPMAHEAGILSCEYWPASAHTYHPMRYFSN
ncbi:hypothetical protein B0H16DRAFT_1727442 [Mycena metata]|uniref:F-box domain-containing protein n=1 Tax=Mycena metata TaxID=1033252 RepID=A0AAD7N3K1_9AGAR|nr:hypothetical protein B0H16DRAFT_1727442 [Mycena metata]